MSWQYWLLIALLVPTLTVYTVRLVRSHMEHKRRMAQIKQMFDDLHQTEESPEDIGFVRDGDRWPWP